MNADDTLREILRSEADSVDPSPAGWNRIRDGVADRRRRRLWLRSSVAAATALAMVSVVAITATRDDDRPGGIVATQPPQPSTSTEPSPSADAARLDEPLPVVWPLTTEREIAFWRANPQSRPALADPKATAEEFVLRYLGLEGADVVSNDGGSILTTTWTVSRLITPGDERTRVTIGRLRVSSFREVAPAPAAADTGSGDGPYLVTQVDAGASGSRSLVITAPTAGTTVWSPIVVTGTVPGVDENVRVEVRAHRAEGAAAHVVLGTAFAPAGGEQPWTTTVTFDAPSDRAGAIYASTRSPADGELSAVSIRSVILGEPEPAGPTPTPSSGYPAQLVAADEGRLAVYDTKTGSRVRYLTEPQPGGGASNPAPVSSGRVVYVQGEGTCATSLRMIRADGTQAVPAVLVPSAPRRVFTEPHVSSRDVLAYVAVGCEGADPVQILVRSLPNDAPTRVIELGLPPQTVVRSLAWSPDGKTLAVVTTTCCDNAAELRQIPATAAKVSDFPVVAPEPDCDWTDVDFSAARGLVASVVCRGVDDGDVTSSHIVALDGTRRTVVDTSAFFLDSISVDPTGDHLLLHGTPCGEICEGEGAVRRFSVDGDPVPVLTGPLDPIWIG